MNLQPTITAAVLAAGVSLSFVAADEPAAVRYEYMEDLSRPIIWARGIEYMEGRFDKAGNFIPSTLPKMVPDDPFPNAHYANRPRGRDRRKHAEKETVYEFRSGFLIRGELQKSGVFIPTVGEKIIVMKDYHYSAEALRIYNLPGVFLRIENGKETGKVDPAP